VRALDLALETLVRLKRDGIAAGPLQSSRAYVLGQYPLRLETARDWAGTLADLEFFGLDRAYIEGYGAALSAVGAAEAKAVIAEAFPAPGDLAIVLVGDAAKIRDAVRKYGPLAEMSLAAPDYSPGAAQR
jgi:zinc protease